MNLYNVYIIIAQITIKYPNFTYKGESKNNLPHGDGIIQCHGKNHEIKAIDGIFQSNVSNGDFYCNCTIELDDKTYSGELRNGTRHGKGVTKYKCGDIYTGEHINNALNGYGIYKFNNDVTYKGYI